MVNKLRGRTFLPTPTTIGGDAALQRSAANVLSPGSGDVISAVDGTVPALRVPNATAFPVLANNGEFYAAAGNPGSARLYWRANGTTYFINAGGTV